MRFPHDWLRGRKSHSRHAFRTRPRVEQLETRLVPYSLSGDAWPHGNLVTISFVPDGTNLGGVTSNLFSTFNAKWATNVWENQILNAAQVWAKATNLNFSVVTDNGGGIGSGNYQQGDPNMGDIRIGGYNFGTSTLASAYLPPPVNNYSIAGDIQFNTGTTFNIGSTYDLFTVAAHEIGHALGLMHSTVANAIMYGSYNTRKTGLNSDDVSGIQAIYGGARTQDAYDAAASNGSFATASNINSTIDPTALTAVVNNLDITTTSDLDYYTFSAPCGTTGTLDLTVQSTGLSLLDPKVTVYAADQTTILGSATPSITNRIGATLNVTINNVTAGQQFYVKVAPYDTTAFGTGAYALTLNFGSGASPTVTLPNTQTLAGSPLSTGGGQAEVPGDEDSPGRDVFTTTDSEAAQHGIASSSQQTRQLAPAFAFTLAAGGAVPLSSPAFAAPVAPAVPASGADQVFVTSVALRGRGALGAGVQDETSDDDGFVLPEPGDDASLSEAALDAFFAQV
jgi:hypothetical protein